MMKCFTRLLRSVHKWCFRFTNILQLNLSSLIFHFIIFIKHFIHIISLKIRYENLEKFLKCLMGCQNQIAFSAGNQLWTRTNKPIHHKIINEFRNNK